MLLGIFLKLSFFDNLLRADQSSIAKKRNRADFLAMRRCGTPSQFLGISTYHCDKSARKTAFRTARSPETRCGRKEGRMSGLSRFLSVLRCFMETKANWTVPELADAIGVPASTVYRTVRELVAQGF